jgi:hypothetical protein
LRRECGLLHISSKCIKAYWVSFCCLDTATRDVKSFTAHCLIAHLTSFIGLVLDAADDSVKVDLVRTFLLGLELLTATSSVELM